MEPFVLLALFAAWTSVSLYLESKKRRERIAIWRQAGRAAGLDHFAEPGSPRLPGLLTAWAGGQKVRFEELLARQEPNGDSGRHRGRLRPLPQAGGLWNHPGEDHGSA